MSGIGENVFEMLAAKDRKSNNKPQDKVEEPETSPVSTTATTAEPTNKAPAEGEDASWTVQSSVKTRRLVPQFSLSRQDLGSENSRNKSVATQDQQKKKVVRFTKDEMLALRKPSKILTSMSDMLEVVSLTTLDPVCFDRLEPEDVVRIWNLESNRNNHNRDMGGRGRGRMGRGGRGEDHHQSGGSTSAGDANVVAASDWSRGNAKAGPWDGGSSDKGVSFELADFAAAALKFRSEMADMKLADGDEPMIAQEDTMERLLREQALAEGGLGDDDDDTMPDWAADDTPVPAADFFKTQQQPAAKRNLLLETLNVKKTLTETKPAPTAVRHNDLSLDASVVDRLLLGSAQPAKPVLLPEVVAEWFYTDPQGQVQGPFSQENMQLWHEAGYFSKELPIKLRSWLAFHPFCVVFPPELALRAFSGLPLEPRPAFPPMPALMASGLLSHEQQMRQQQQQQIEQQRQQHELFLREQQHQLEQQRLAIEYQQKEEQQRAEAARQQQQHQQRASKPVASGPPPLVPALHDAKSSAGNAGASSVDPLRKIRISTNITELNAGSGNSPVAANSGGKRSAANTEPKKQSSSTQPPPLIVQETNAKGSNGKNSTGAPWTGDAASAGGNKESLHDIQQAERERSEKDRMAREAEARQQQIIKGKGWASSGAAAGAAKLVTASLSEIQQEEESRQRDKQRAAEAQTSAAAPLTMSSQLKSLLGVKTAGLPAAPTSPAPKQWGGATSSDASNAKSLREIMQQEERPSASAGSGKRQQATSWASKAGTGVNATNLAPAPIQQQQQHQSRDHHTNNPVNASSGVSNQRTSNGNSGAKPTPASNGNDFGGKGTSREVSEWCSAQLRKITGSDDDLSALVDFCMSLDSASEIREYLSQYLGSSPQLTNFATDFIKFKEQGGSGGKKGVSANDTTAKRKPQQQKQPQSVGK